jgi:glycosyltransferase involved in cell wall biosynthesis
LYRNKTIGVVVPAFNEEPFIGEVIKTMPEFVDRIFVVNDCSSDNTLGICHSLSDQRLMVISHQKRSGPGAAMLTGYKKACEEKMDVTAIMAGDGQMDPQILDRIIEPVCQGKADYTKGDRLSVPVNRRGMPFLRRFGNRLLTFIIRVASGYWQISDPLNGYTAISKDTLAKLNLDKIEPGYAFETDLLIKLGGAEAKVVNVDMAARYRNEKSKLAYLRFMLYTSWVIFRDYAWRLSRPRKKNRKIQPAKADARESESC